MKRNKEPKSDSGNKRNARVDNRAEQRHQKESQVAQLSAANVEESPHMDRGDSEGGSGQSVPTGESKRAGDAQKRGALDTQYGTKSSPKSNESAVTTSGAAGGSDDAAPKPASPGPSEEPSGSERDTMSGPRPGSRS